MALRSSQKKPLVINPFSVSIQSSGKKRLIADLRHLNRCLRPPLFKMDDYKAALPALRRGNYLFGFDLEKGYYHIDLATDVQKYFGFRLEFEGEVYLVITRSVHSVLALFPNFSLC